MAPITLLTLASCCGPPLPDALGVLIWTWVMGVCGVILTLEGIALLVMAYRRQRSVLLRRQKLPVAALTAGVVALGLAINGWLMYSSLMQTQPASGDWYGLNYWYEVVGSAVTTTTNWALVIAIATLALLAIGVVRTLMED